MESLNTKAGWGRTFKAAFPYTVPVMTGYLVLSAAYGVLMQSKGYGPLWSTLTSALAFSGSMQYAAVIVPGMETMRETTRSIRSRRSYSASR